MMPARLSRGVAYWADRRMNDKFFVAQVSNLLYRAVSRISNPQA